MSADGEVWYLCHDCGAQLWFVYGSRLLWCDRCGKRRRIPTHPALVMSKPPGLTSFS